MDRLFLPGFGAPAGLYRPALAAGWIVARAAVVSRHPRCARRRIEPGSSRSSTAPDGPVWLAGHSMGGALAVLAAAERPERIARLTLISPAGLPLQKPMAASLADFGRQLASGSYAGADAVVAVGRALAAPRSALRLAREVRALDLTLEMERVRRSGVPVEVVACATDTLVTPVALPPPGAASRRALPPAARSPAATCGCSAAPEQLAAVLGVAAQRCLTPRPVPRHGGSRMGADRLRRLRRAAGSHLAAPPPRRRRARGGSQADGVRGRGRGLQPAAGPGLDAARDSLRTPRPRRRRRGRRRARVHRARARADPRALGALPRVVAADVDSRRRRRRGGGRGRGRRARRLGPGAAELGASRGPGAAALARLRGGGRRGGGDRGSLGRRGAPGVRCVRAASCAGRSRAGSSPASFLPLPLLLAAGTGGSLSLVWTAFKVGALSYGGGFVIVPLMQSDAVGRYHWLTQSQFLNAVALGQITPGPGRADGGRGRLRRRRARRRAAGGARRVLAVVRVRAARRRRLRAAPLEPAPRRRSWPVPARRRSGRSSARPCR